MARQPWRRQALGKPGGATTHDDDDVDDDDDGECDDIDDHGHLNHVNDLE